MPGKSKIKRRKDGRIRRSITVGVREDGSPIRKYAYGYTDSDLEDNYAALRNQLNMGSYADDEGLTVAAWVKQWLNIYYKNKEHYTRTTCERNIRLHILPKLGMLRLRDVKPYQVKAVISALESAGKIRTAEQCLSYIRMMMEEAVDNDLIAKSPARKIKIDTKSKSARRALTDDEIDMLVSAALSTKERAFAYIALFGGLRRAEILALSPADIDMVNGSVTVSKAVYFDVNQAHFKDPKTFASSRRVSLPQHTLFAISAHIATCSGPHLFESRSGGLMSLTVYRRMWRYIRTKAWGEDSGISCHMLRHTYATMLYYSGVDIKQAQSWMGHADIKTLLNLYTHLDKEKEGDAKEKYSKYTATAVNRGSKRNIAGE